MTLRRSGIKPKRARRMSKPGGTVTPELRDEVLTRDLGCMAHRMGFDLDVPCPSPFKPEGRLVVHHRRIDKSDNRLDNLLTLCDTHHKRAHDRLRAEAEACGVIIRRGSATLPPGEPQ